MSNAAFDSIPKPEPLPSGGAGRGPGLSAPELDKIKAADILDKDIAVMGYLIIPNRYKDDPVPGSGPDEVTVIEVMDAEGNVFAMTHASQVLMSQVEQRQERGEIPFRTKLVKATSSAGRQYYTFE